VPFIVSNFKVFYIRAVVGYRYVPSMTDLTFSWSGFDFVLPVKYYEWGLGALVDPLSPLDCRAVVSVYLHSMYHKHMDQRQSQILSKRYYCSILINQYALPKYLARIMYCIVVQ